MTHKLAIINDLDQTALEEQVSRWKKAEDGLERCTLFARVMQGLCLAELRKIHGNSNRGNPNLRNSPITSENWADYVRGKWGFSDDKARLLIQVGEAAKPRLRKLAEDAQAGLGALIDRPLSTLSAPEMKALETVTHKLTDGKTSRMLQEELGLFKGDGPRAPLGGYHPRQGPEPTLEERTAALRTLAEANFKDLIVSLDTFAISKRKAGYDLLGDHDQRIFENLIRDLHKTYCRK